MPPVDSTPYPAWKRRLGRVGGKAWAFPLVGLISLIWFLVRVIPKPSRATYPCQQAAFPIASGFVLWVVGLTTSVALFHHTRQKLHQARYVVAALSLAAAIAAVGITFVNTPTTPAVAQDDPLFVPADGPNQPMGEPRGIHPGRVVWVRDPEATRWDGTGYWWTDDNTDGAIVGSMVSRSLRTLASETSDQAAWDALFHHYNRERGRGDTGYQTGERIAIKLNLNRNASHTGKANHPFSGPQMVLSWTRQLVYGAGVPDSMITFYDATRFVPDTIFDAVRAEFPGVRFVDWEGGSGREQYARDTAARINWSEELTMEGGNPTYLPTCVTQADYVINLANLRGHTLAGVTMNAKNHFGTICADLNGWPTHTAPFGAGVHPYIAVHDIGDYEMRQMGTYNPLVDLMGREHVGGKTLLFIIDGLYATPDQTRNLDGDHRWQMPPFDGNWPASLFVSQDGVAIESVGLDFLRTEPTLSEVYGNVDNYLHEAALAHAAPSGTVYDPEGDGTRVTSLGVHEHWNNPVDKLYSGNLGLAGGIELVTPVEDEVPATRSGLTYQAFQFADDQVPEMDGELSDWDVMPAELFFDYRDHGEVLRGKGIAHDRANLHIKRAAVGWNDRLNRLYFMAEVYDDYHRFHAEDPDMLDTFESRFQGTGRAGNDLWEIVIDADHGGELVVGYSSDEEEERLNRSTYTQNYHLFIPPLDGYLWHWLLGAATWTDDPRYSGAGWHFEGGHTDSGTVTYECYLTPFDLLHPDGPEQSVVHDLSDDEIIGLNWAFVDWDTPGDSRDFWSLFGQPGICCDGEALSDFHLMPLGASVRDYPPGTSVLTPDIDLYLEPFPLTVPPRFRDLVPADLAMHLPAGFSARVFAATGLSGPRSMAFSPDGVLHVANMNAGGAGEFAPPGDGTSVPARSSMKGQILALPDEDHDGVADTALVVAENLWWPHSLAFHEGDLYVADQHAIRHYTDTAGDGPYEELDPLVEDIPIGGQHITKTLLFDDVNEKLYVSVGSSCDVCREEDPERAVVLEFNADGSGRRVFATGLRNAVGMALHPATNQLWATNNGHSSEGPDLPPEWIDIVRPGEFYGWPFAYPHQVYVDFSVEEFGSMLPLSRADSLAVQSMRSPVALLPAHLQPMAIHFYGQGGFPSQYHHAAFIALSGSPFAGVPGHKVMVLFSEPDGSNARVADFFTGFQPDPSDNSGVWGRPVGITSDDQGNLYVSSDWITPAILKIVPARLTAVLRTDLPERSDLGGNLEIDATVDVEQYVVDGGGEVTVRADLSDLGGPGSVALTRREETVFHLSTTLVPRESGVKTIKFSIEQFTPFGVLATELTRDITIAEQDDVVIIGDEIGTDWTVTVRGGVELDGISTATPIHAGETAAVFRIEQAGRIGWAVTTQATEPLGLLGLTALHLAFRPENLALPDSPRLSIAIKPGTGIDLLQAGLIDLEQNEWQVVEIELFEFELEDPIESVSILGNWEGTFYLDDLRLARAPDDTPIIRSITPPHGVASIATPVEIRGSNFHDDATVRFGDREATHVRFVSPFLMTAVTPALAPDTVDVSIVNPGIVRGVLDDAFTFVPALFSPPVNYRVGRDATSLFTADFDGDGDHDLAIANGGSHTVSVLMNHGDGTFADKVDYAIGQGSANVFGADFDGDGDDDLAVSNGRSASVSVLLNNGDGTFADRVDYPTGESPIAIFSADFNGDGAHDLVVGRAMTVDSVSVLLNDGDGTFGPPVDYAASGPASVISTDLDGDTDNDLVVANADRDRISVLLNNGDGTFASGVGYAALDGPLRVFSADFDGDGDNDVAARHWGSPVVSVWMNNGDGSLGPRADYDGPTAWGIFSADFDHDGDNDLAAPGFHDRSVSVLLNNGDGTFGMKLDYAVGAGPYAVVGADFDADGDIDLAVPNLNANTVSILLNTTDPPAVTAVLAEGDRSAVPTTFALHQNYPNPFNSSTSIRIDLHRNDEVELAIYSVLGQKVVTLLEGPREAGSYSVRWDGRDGAGHELASGVYLYRIRTGTHVQTRKLLMLQ